MAKTRVHRIGRTFVARHGGDCAKCEVKIHPGDECCYLNREVVHTECSTLHRSHNRMAGFLKERYDDMGVKEIETDRKLKALRESVVIRGIGTADWEGE